LEFSTTEEDLAIFISLEAEWNLLLLTGQVEEWNLLLLTGQVEETVQLCSKLSASISILSLLTMASIRIAKPF